MEVPLLLPLPPSVMAEESRRLLGTEAGGEKEREMEAAKEEERAGGGGIRAVEGADMLRVNEDVSSKDCEAEGCVGNGRAREECTVEDEGAAEMEAEGLAACIHSASPLSPLDKGFVCALIKVLETA